MTSLNHRSMENVEVSKQRFSQLKHHDDDNKYALLFMSVDIAGARCGALVKEGI
jgi:hypothetical protein